MSETICVQIIGAPIACKEGLKDAWRKTAAWASGQLRQRFGDAVDVYYYDLFEPSCPPIPAEAQLPLVLINGELLSSGGKISVPAMRRKIETLIRVKNLNVF